MANFCLHRKEICHYHGKYIADVRFIGVSSFIPRGFRQFDDVRAGAAVLFIGELLE